MVGMSLFPSESAAFPDLVGQQHGYLPPNLRRPSRRRRRQPSGSEIAPPPAEAAAANGIEHRCETEIAPLETLTPLTEAPPAPEHAPRDQTTEQRAFSEIAPPLAETLETSGVAPRCETEIAPLEPLTPLVGEPPPPEDAPVCDQALEQLSRYRQQQPSLSEIAPSLAEAPAATRVAPRSITEIAPLEPFTPLVEEPPTQEHAPVCDHTFEQLLIPFGVPAAANVVEPLLPIDHRRAESESPQPAIRKNTLPKPPPAPRVALPIPPQRSPAQMRSKIQPQDTPPPTPSQRPRTPARGLAIAAPPPAVVETPTSTWSSRIPLLHLPRRCLHKLMRFVVSEAIAVAVLMLAMGFGFSQQVADPASLVLKILAAAAAIAAIAVPVIFYGLPDELPRSDR